MKTKNILTTLLVLSFVITAFAQQGINYKAIIKDGDGNAIANTATTVRFTILENGTTNVYQEIHTPTTDANGIIIVNIGEGMVFSGVFNIIDWGSNPHFLKTEINSGSGLTDMGTTEFKTVPYALYAKNGSGANELNDLSDAKSDGSSIFIGLDVGLNDDGNNFNTAIGNQAFRDNTVGGSNTGIGKFSLLQNITGYRNTAIGERTLLGNTLGNNNTAIGYNAGVNCRGDGNVFIGHYAGFNWTGSNKLFIGNSNINYIPLIGGDFDTKEVTIDGDLEVIEKVTAPDSGNSDMKAYIYGSVNKNGYTTSQGSTSGFTVYKELLASSLKKYSVNFNGVNKPVSELSYIVFANCTSDVVALRIVKYADYFAVYSGVDVSFDFVVYKK